MPRLRHVWPCALVLALSPLACGSGLERPANASTQDLPIAVVTKVDEPAPAPVEPAGPPRLPEYQAKVGDEIEPHRAIEDPSGLALRHFQRALMELDSGGQDKVRVLHLGDSTLGVDGIPHAVRTRMQQRFGDGGPGLVLLKRYSLSYKPASVALHGGDDWTHCYIAYKCRGDGHYGIGGLIVSSTGGATTTIASLPAGATGTEFSQVELWYAASDAGGSIALELDGELAKTIDTGVPGQLELEDRWDSFAVEPGAHTVKVRAAGGGKTRLYGVVLEHERPGVV